MQRGSEEDLLLVCMLLGLSACALFMDGISKGQRCIREMYKGREGEEKDRYRLPFFFSYAFLSLASLTHIVNFLFFYQCGYPDQLARAC